MELRRINAENAPLPQGGAYSSAVEISNPERMLFVSGQIPVDLDGAVPEDFMAQGRLVWRNVVAQLEAAGMTLDNVVKVNVFLSDRKFAMDNRALRHEVLGERCPALTVIVCDIFDAAWLLEIEVVAAA